MVNQIGGSTELIVNTQTQQPVKRPIIDKICTIAKYTLLALGAALATAAITSAFSGVIVPVVCALGVSAALSVIVGGTIALVQKGTRRNQQDGNATLAGIIAGGPLDMMVKNKELDDHKQVLFRSAIDRYEELGLETNYKVKRYSTDDLADFFLSWGRKPSYFSKPLNLALDDYQLDVQVSNGFYDFDFEENEYTVDFANQYLGGGALKGGFVQEEILCAEFPELANYIAANLEKKGRYAGRCRELTRYRGNGMSSASGIKEGSPSPVIFKNLHRVQEVKGVYGHKLYNLSPSNLKADHINILQEPQKANILAIAASNITRNYPRAIRDKLSRGTLLTNQEKDTLLTTQTSVDAIEDYYNTFFSGISLAQREERGDAVIKSGKLGCGVFGNNTRVCLVLQAIAAQEAGVELQLYGVSNQEKQWLEEDFHAVIQEAKSQNRGNSIEELLEVVGEVMYQRL